MKYIVCFVVAIAIMFGGGLAMAAEAKKAPVDAFTAMDTDKDGKVSKVEYTAGKTGAALTKAEEHFKALDKNGDGFLTKEEFSAPVKPAGKKK